MGASNALRAYDRYASVVPPLSMVVLTYMALVSKDSDPWPWFGLGRHAIAEVALGRPDPGESDLRAVQRALTPLVRAGAITVDRAAAARPDGNSTARYRLNLDARSDAERDAWQARTQDGKRPVDNPETQDGKRPASDPQRRTENVVDAGRFVTGRRTVCDWTQDEFRPPKEEEEPRGAREEQRGDLDPAPHPPRVAGQAEPAEVIQLFARATDRSARKAPRPTRAAELQQALADASAHRRAAEASHRANQEAQ